MKYRIAALQKIFSGVNLSIVKWIPPVPLSPEDPSTSIEEEVIIDPLKNIIPESDEEKMAFNFIQAFKKFGINLPTPKQTSPMIYPVHFAKVEVPIEVPISDEEFLKLGKPSIGQLLELTIKQVDEE